jgi:predicted SAM-dependent methyltransferase
VSKVVDEAEQGGLPPQGDDVRSLDRPGTALALVARDMARDKGPRMERGGAKRVLNAGSGLERGGLHPGFHPSAWKEVRIDIDPGAVPDLVGSISDMRGVVEDGSFDAVWCSHCIEHLHDHEVLPALREFGRILSDDGFAIVTCPNLEAIARLLVSEDIESVAYLSPAGPIRLLDMIFGYSRSIEAGNVHMTHRTGFTADRLGRMAIRAGFAEARVLEGENYDLWAALLMPKAELSVLAAFFEGTSIAALFHDQSISSASPPHTSGRKRVRILGA